MTIDPFLLDAQSGTPVYGAQELRLGVTALIAGAGNSIGARSGVRRSGSETDLLVAAQTTPNMTVQVYAGQAVVQGATSTAQGAYIYTLDTATTVTIGASDPSLTRYDRLCIRIRDAAIDTSGAADGGIVVITGTPGGGVPTLPTSATYYELARVTVPGGAANIGGGGGQGFITDMRNYTCAAGGRLTGTSAARVALAGMPPGQSYFETDTGKVYTWSGTTWAADAVTTVATKTASYTLVDTDGTVLANGSSITITLPAAASAGTGRAYTVKNINATTLTVASNGGTIDNAATIALNRYQSRTVLSDGANWWIV